LEVKTHKKRYGIITKAFSNNDFVGGVHFEVKLAPSVPPLLVAVTIGNHSARDK
jgi:hypothetical protein